MAITETKIVSRPNNGIPFFSQTDNAELLAAKAAMGTFNWTTNSETHQTGTNASGSHIIERIYSGDFLTQTNKMTFDSVDTWSAVDSALTIALDKEYFVYAEANGLTHLLDGQYTLTGIDTAFSCTTTYTYGSITDDSFFNIFLGSLENSDNLTNFTNTGSQLIAVHAYVNAAEFTTDHWADRGFINFLQENGITRTISYALVSNDA
jgi:hypothetical protein